jgi:hypothetical protein
VGIAEGESSNESNHDLALQNRDGRWHVFPHFIPNGLNFIH